MTAYNQPPHLPPDAFDRYLDGMLDPAERAATEAHLTGCAACRAELAALRRVYAALDALPPAPLPADLAGPVLARLAPAPAPAPRRVALAWAALGAQLALTVALAAWLLATRDLPAPVLPAPPDLAALARQVAAGALAPLGAGPVSALTMWQWALAVGAAGAIWLVGNRLLLAGAADRPRRDGAA
ncbi:MAG TPA: zf-HC2 domain-containing protein [Thermomicrobiales bacterium]|nr:zf-HC2 domain-containing protein [Thermomicrobiales bacterium]